MLWPGRGPLTARSVLRRVSSLRRQALPNPIAVESFAIQAASNQTKGEHMSTILKRNRVKEVDVRHANNVAYVTDTGLTWQVSFDSRLTVDELTDIQGAFNAGVRDQIKLVSTRETQRAKVAA
jgi:hypothetical protein